MKIEIKKFSSTASLPDNGLVVIFDLEDFSQFYSQPDVQDYVPKYLNHVIEAISIVIYGGRTYWRPKPEVVPALPKPIHWKFLGDGLMIIWKYKDFNAGNLTSLLNRLWNLKEYFSQVNKIASEDVPVIDIPARIRFGISAGTIYKLTYNLTKSEEFIGYSINLASRLQNYCGELGFIASARVNPPKANLEKNGYKRVIATKIKGFPREIVIVDKSEYNNLDAAIRTNLFDELN